MNSTAIRIKKIFLATVMGAFISLNGLFVPLNFASAACSNSFLGLPTWYKYLELDGQCRIVGPAKQVTGPSGDLVDNVDISKAIPRVLLAVIDILMRLAGTVAFFYIILSGFKFVLAQGSPDKEKAARQALINSVIGLLISIFAIGVMTALGKYLVK